MNFTHYPNLTLASPFQQPVSAVESSRWTSPASLPRITVTPMLSLGIQKTKQ